MASFLFPDQTIPESQKTKEWHIEHVLSYASYAVGNNYNEQRLEMLKYFRAYNAELNNEERELAKVITCPNGIDLGLEYVVYPLIQSKTEQLIGEYMTRPIRRKAYVVDKKSRNEKFEKKVEMLAEEFMREISEKLKNELGFQPETGNPELEIPEHVEAFFENDFKTIAEQIADSITNIFLDVRKEKHKFADLFRNYCITDRAHAVLERKHGFTSLRPTHPLDCDYDMDPYKVVQDDHEYWFENYYLTEHEIYNTFDLSQKQKNQVKEYFTAFQVTDSSSYESHSLETSQKYDGWLRTSNKVNRLRLIFGMWKSRKRVSLKVAEDNYGNEQVKKLPEDYKERKKDKIEHIDGEMPRYCVMLGPNICLEWGLMEERYSPVDSPYKCYLPVLSIVRDNTVGTGLIKSVAAKLYQLQQMASELLYEIRLAIKHAGESRVLLYDVAQTPKQFSKGAFETGLNRVMTHIKKDKLMIINSQQKGFNANFNQFQSLDLSQKGALQDLFNALAIIEDLAAKFVGIAPEREGQIGQYQTGGNAEKALRGSYARTEVLFTPFDHFIQALLEKVILKAKYDYEPGEVIHYIFGDMKTKFLKLLDPFFLSDYGLFLADASKDKEAAERIDQAAQMAMSTASSPELIMKLIEVFEGESASEKKQVFQQMLNSLEEVRQQNIKASQEQAQAEAQAEAAREEKEAQLKREGFENNIEVAEIYARGKHASDLLKSTSQERIKAAELETQIATKQKEKSE